MVGAFILKEEVKRKISDALDLPKDVVLNIPKVTITGRIAVFIENHKGIIQYSSQKVKVNTPIGIVIIKGNGLSIKSILADEITIEGNISALDFDE